MHKLFGILSLILLSMLLWHCSADPIIEGDKAYAAGKFDEALKHYFEAKKAQPENTLINEKIALSYGQRGMQLYKRTRNVASFFGNIERAQKYVPQDNGSSEFNKVYSVILFELAQAYHQAKPENPVQEEQFFSKTLDYLDQALLLDYENEPADSLLAAIRLANFQKMFDRGKRFLEQAKKEKTNNELFISAEIFLNRAVSFDPSNTEAVKALKEVRQRLLRILDLNIDFPMAIAAMQYTANHLLLDLAAFNNLGERLTFDPARLKLVDMDNNEYDIDLAETQKYERALTQPVVVENRKQLDGNVAFKISRKVPLQYLRYELESGKPSKKYFP
jgi:hypothetical protein